MFSFLILTSVCQFEIIIASLSIAIPTGVYEGDPLVYEVEHFECLE